MLLAHQFDDSLKTPGPGDEIGIGIFSGDDFTNYNSIGQTRTWNWQTGSMLQWIGDSMLIIFNDFDSEKHISNIITPDGEYVRSLPRPIAAISCDGKYALSHSFVRLQKYAPAYGYANGSDPEEDISVPEEDGLYFMEVQFGGIDRLFSVAEIAKIQSEPSMENAYHYFTHCQFSPSGKRFIFYHRWLTKKGRTWTRMISCDLEGRNLFIFPTTGVVTHMAWRDDETVLAYGSTKEFGDHFYLFEDRTGKFSVFGEDKLTSDGHHQFSPDRSKLITDTYPNRSRIQYLILYEIGNDKKIDLAKIHSPFRYREELRCDLHPRWDRKGEMICFDSTHTGIRTLCTLRL